MDKLHLVSTFEKYYLNGIVERVKMQVKDKNVTINFVAPNKDLVGCVDASEFELDDAELGIYDTSQLLKLINITNSFLTLEAVKEHNIPTKLLIADNEYNLEYILADTTMIPNVPTISEPEYDIEADIDLEFITKFIKAKKALDTEVFSVDANYDETKSKVVRFVLGGNQGYTNKIQFTVPATYEGIQTKQLQFNINYMREILDTNKDLTTGKLRICSEGLMRIDFTSEKGTSFYLLVAKE
jgi:hypothetical protein